MKKNGIIINSETTTYYKNGKFHREDGPAVECGNGYKEWWIDGEKITEEEFNQRQQNKQT